MCDVVPDRGMGHSEESRLANLLRRVSREDDRDRRLSTLRQLKEFISHSESKVVSFNTLLFLSHKFHNFFKVYFISCQKWVVDHSLNEVHLTLAVDRCRFFFMVHDDFFFHRPRPMPDFFYCFFTGDANRERERVEVQSIIQLC